MVDVGGHGDCAVLLCKSHLSESTVARVLAFIPVISPASKPDSNRAGRISISFLFVENEGFVDDSEIAYGKVGAVAASLIRNRGSS